uniref:WAT1-related protein n=1 Tax=Brassica campestris TaxID=3711 RepID=M4EFG1_BRACM
MEKVSIRKDSSLAKVLGTLLSIVGALVVTLYHGPVLMSLQSDWVIGGGLLALQNILYSFSYLVMDDSKAWMIRFDKTLISLVATGILNSVYYIVHTWAVIYKGPVYLSMFKPLSILIAAASTTIFLSESIYLGILIGGILISVGFYMVLWGKAKEAKVDILGTIESSPSHEAPLLGS